VSLRRRAGIAQLVEQATENRRVPSSNLGPGISRKRLKRHVKAPYLVLLRAFLVPQAPNCILLKQ
jgi:hypothetical protein